MENKPEEDREKLGNQKVKGKQLFMGIDGVVCSVLYLPLSSMRIN